MINPKPGKFYWAFYECRLTIIQAAGDNSGFWSLGQEWLHDWKETEILEEAKPESQIFKGLLLLE